MIPPLPELVEGMRRALRDDVRPELATDHARSQLAGVLDILGKVERLLVWSPDVLHEQLATLRAGCAAFAERAAGEGARVESLAPLPPGPMRQARLEAELRTAERQFDRHTDWLFTEGASMLGLEARRQLDAVLQGTLRELLTAERKLIASADFGAMTTGAADGR